MKILCTLGKLVIVAVWVLIAAAFIETCYRLRGV